MKIDIDLKEKSYSVFIDELAKISLPGKVAIITNPKVSGLWLSYLLERLECGQKFIITIPDGEEYKSLASVEQILEQLFSSKLDRKSTLIALGGGVISDITGFCASIYERGINFLPVDLYKSHSTKFLMEEDGIRPPLNSIPGLGSVAAIGIQAAREEEKFMCIDDLQARAKIGKSVTELLSKFGCLKGMTQSNQMSLFV